MHCVVVGTGYVGLVTSAVLANRGIKITCIDKNPVIVQKIRAGNTPIHEEGLEPLLHRALSQDLLQIYSSMNDVTETIDAVFIAVGTPSDQNGIDLSYIEGAASEIGSWLKQQNNYVVIIMKSTVIPTTTDIFVRSILEYTSNKKCGIDFGLCMNPEFLREGQAVADCMNPDRIVIGQLDERSGNVLRAIYSSFETDFFACNLRTAEMIKYVSNAFLATTISFANEMANICSATGDIDIKEVMRGVHLDARLNPKINGSERVNPGILSYLEAGCGFGGSCFPKDVKALKEFAHSSKVPVKILDAVLQTNETQPNKMLELLDSAYPNTKNLKIAMLGIAFKPGTDDVRASPALAILDVLINNGHEIKIYDPIVKTLPAEYKEIIIAGSLSAAIDGVDAALIMTSWPEFMALTSHDFRKYMRKSLVIDGRRMLKKESFAKGEYLGIGTT